MGFYVEIKYEKSVGRQKRAAARYWRMQMEPKVPHSDDEILFPKISNKSLDLKLFVYAQSNSLRCIIKLGSSFMDKTQGC